MELRPALTSTDRIRERERRHQAYGWPSRSSRVMRPRSGPPVPFVAMPDPKGVLLLLLRIISSIAYYCCYCVPQGASPGVDPLKKNDEPARSAGANGF